MCQFHVTSYNLLVTDTTAWYIIANVIENSLMGAGGAYMVNKVSVNFLG